MCLRQTQQLYGEQINFHERSENSFQARFRLLNHTMNPKFQVDHRPLTVEGTGAETEETFGNLNCINPVRYITTRM
ncbi:hypothetical protein MAR_010789 [Mya arenaria]|uniref:Uncharacterized protein n=1 Tax=Mya arenaria TaxID=6604 RepID=A0ABY7FS86_MYAAR|nr:hypothetical protein MAR_010789 [Mya arenaria]